MLLRHKRRWRRGRRPGPGRVRRRYLVAGQRKSWGAVKTLVFWLVVLAVLWVLASRYNAGAAQG